MRTNQKSRERIDVAGRLRAGKVALPPLTLRWKEGAGKAGARVEVAWAGRRYAFVAECRAGSTPRVVEEAALQAKKRSRPPKTWPLVVVPYLSDDRLAALEADGVSGIDLSGNGVVLVPGQLLVRRSGQPNLFPQSFPIKNVYRKASSMVARVFLLRKEFPTVTEVLEETRRRGGEVSLSTVSKVISRLEDDLVVGRQGGGVRVLQADKLLDLLAANYEPPEVRRRFLGKCSLSREELQRRLIRVAESGDVCLAMTGVSSTGRYAVMAREDVWSIYCTGLDPVLGALRDTLRETDRFPNVEFLETIEELPYFDRREDAGWPWASATQTYLELARGDKREQETADQVRKRILSGAS